MQSQTLFFAPKNAWGSVLPVNYSHRLYSGQSFAVASPVSISVTHDAWNPSTALLTNCTVTAAAPLNLSLALQNNAYTIDPRKYAVFGRGGSSDPAYGIQNSTVTGSADNDSITISTTEMVRQGWFTNLQARAISSSTISLGAGDDTLSSTATTDSTAFRDWKYGTGGYAVAIEGKIDMGDGNDRLIAHAILNNVTSGEAHGLRGTANLGAGNDYASFTATSTVSGLPGFGLRYATVDAGSGDDDVIIGSSRDSRITMGDGNDRLTCGGTYRQDFLLADGGNGVDTLILPGVREDYTAKKDRIDPNYAPGGIFNRVGLTSEQSWFVRSVEIQNGGVGSTGSLVGSFKWQGMTASGFEFLEVAGGVFDLSTRQFI